MDTGAVVAIVIGALALVALVTFVAIALRKRRLESRRTEAGELRREAQQRSLRAEPPNHATEAVGTILGKEQRAAHG